MLKKKLKQIREQQYFAVIHRGNCTFLSSVYHSSVSSTVRIRVEAKATPARPSLPTTVAVEASNDGDPNVIAAQLHTRASLGGKPHRRGSMHMYLSARQRCARPCSFGYGVWFFSPATSGTKSKRRSHPHSPSTPRKPPTGHATPFSCSSTAVCFDHTHVLLLAAR